MKEHDVAEASILRHQNRHSNAMIVIDGEEIKFKNRIQVCKRESDEYSCRSEYFGADSLKSEEGDADVDPEQRHLRDAVELDCIWRVEEDDSCEGDGEAPEDEEDQLERGRAHPYPGHVQHHVEEHWNEHRSCRDG